MPQMSKTEGRRGTISMPLQGGRRGPTAQALCANSAVAGELAYRCLLLEPLERGYKGNEEWM